MKRFKSIGWFSSKPNVILFATFCIIFATVGVYRLFVSHALAPTNANTYYSKFSNGLPSSSSFFPIAVFDQYLARGDVPAPNTNEAEQMASEGINVDAGIDNWPSAYGEDTSPDGPEFPAACANGIYFIGSHNVGTAASGAVNSGASVLGAANSNSGGASCAKYMVGYMLGDEQACGTEVAAQVAASHALDPTRMGVSGLDGFFPTEPSASCIATMNASDINSGDVYEITNPWEGSVCNVPGGASDCLWGYGAQTTNMVNADTAGHPTWVDLDSGTDNLAFSSQNGSVCNTATNLCSDGNEERATPPQVNAAAWDTLINGSNGLLWFCDDSVSASDACLGGGTNGNPADCSPT
ncbi:MAG: hypothetical protein ACREGF_04280, partial [Candidatus Saccharimonadales bacterium]